MQLQFILVSTTLWIALSDFSKILTYLSRSKKQIILLGPFIVQGQTSSWNLGQRKAKSKKQWNWNCTFRKLSPLSLQQQHIKYVLKCRFDSFIVIPVFDEKQLDGKIPYFNSTFEYSRKVNQFHISDWTKMPSFRFGFSV